MHDGHETEFARLTAELATFPTLLRRAATTNNKELFRVLLKDVVEVVDAMDLHAQFDLPVRPTLAEQIGATIRHGARMEIERVR